MCPAECPCTVWKIWNFTQFFFLLEMNFFAYQLHYTGVGWLYNHFSSVSKIISSHIVCPSSHTYIQCKQNFLESSLKCDTFDNFRWKRQKLKLKPYTKYLGMLIICTKIFALKFFQIPWAWYCKVRLSVWRFCLGTKRIKKVMKFHT